MDHKIKMPEVAAMKTTRTESTGKSIENKGAISESTPRISISGDVHHNVSEGLVIDFSYKHWFLLENCTINGQPFHPNDTNS